MAEVKNAFIKSKMNKDLDDRLIPQGEYREGINIQVSKSEGQDVGALENVLGNNPATLSDGTAVDFSVIAGLATGTLTTIGIHADTNTNNIFIFLTDNITLNYSSSSNNYVFSYNTLTKNVTTLLQGSFLNFSTQSPIYGVNLLENLLFFTDNRNQPRKINIDRVSNGTFYINEDQISVAKYNPYQTIDLYYEKTSGNFVTSLQNVTDETLADGSTVNPDYSANWPGDPDYLEDKFVSFSYRFKYIDGEYSILAPFTQEAFIPQQDGYFLVGDQDRAYRSTIVEFMENQVNNVGIYIPMPLKIDGSRATVSELNSIFHVDEIDILFKESDGLAVKVLDSIPANNFGFVSGSPNTATKYTYQYQSRKPYKTLAESEIIRVYDKVPVKALGQEVISNRIVYSNFQDKHTPPVTLEYDVGASDKDAFQGPETGSTANPATWTTSIVEYPMHTLKQNRTYQVGFVLSDRFGRSSTVILSPVSTETQTINGIELGGSTFYHPYTPAPTGGVTNDINSWPGDSLKVQLNEQVSSDAPNAITGWPGLYNGDPSSASYNPMGWYSYKLVVKQTEQDYYNVYLPGILNGYPNGQTGDDPANTVGFIMLLNDNINKVPRDLSEVGPEQKQFRSSVQLFCKVTPDSAGPPTHTEPNYPVANTTPTSNTIATIADQQDIFGASATSLTDIYETKSDPSLARFTQVSTTSTIGSAGAAGTYNFLLGVFETAPVVSLLDIFYETSSSGLISDLNASVSTGAQVSGFINFDFIQTEATGVGANITTLAFSPSVDSLVGDVAIVNSSLSLISVTDGNGSDVTSNWNQPVATGATPAAYNITTNKVLYYDTDLNKNNFTFIFEVTNNDGVSPVITRNTASNIKLGNVAPTITNTLNADGQISVTVIQGTINVTTITAVNGCADPSQETKDIEFSISPSTTLQIDPASGAITEPTGSATGFVTATVTATDTSGSGLSTSKTLRVIFGEEPINSEFGNASKTIGNGLESSGFYWAAENVDAVTNGDFTQIPSMLLNTNGNNMNRFPLSEMYTKGSNFTTSTESYDSNFSDPNGNKYQWFLSNELNSGKSGLTAGTAFVKIEIVLKNIWAYVDDATIMSQRLNSLSNCRLLIGVPVALQYRTGPGSTWSTATDVEGNPILIGGTQAFTNIGSSTSLLSPRSTGGVRTNATEVISNGFPPRIPGTLKTSGAQLNIPIEYPNAATCSGGNLTDSVIFQQVSVFGDDQMAAIASKFGEYRLLVSYPQNTFSQQGAQGGSAILPANSTTGVGSAWAQSRFNLNRFMDVSVDYGDFYYPQLTGASTNGVYGYKIAIVGNTNRATASLNAPSITVYAKEWSFRYVTQFYLDDNLSVKLGTNTNYALNYVANNYYVYTGISGEDFNVIHGSENANTGGDNETPSSNTTNRSWTAQFDIDGKKIPQTALPCVANIT
jgi:hypothetical protein